MLFPWRIFYSLACAGTLSAAPMTPAATPAPRRAWWTQRDDPVVEVTKICPSIFLELRYATERNFTGRPIYPRRARCLLRRSIAERLCRAQEELRAQGFGLKIWDAYRPKWAHQKLWDAAPNPEYVATPVAGGSFHSWGVCVDVTLVDAQGREQPMPTDFDDFTPAAKSLYEGAEPQIAKNLQTLRTAMANAGFVGIRDEWWHFTAVDAMLFAPIYLPLEKGGAF